MTAWHLAQSSSFMPQSRLSCPFVGAAGLEANFSWCFPSTRGQCPSWGSMSVRKFDVWQRKGSSLLYPAVRTVLPIRGYEDVKGTQLPTMCDLALVIMLADLSFLFIYAFIYVFVYCQLDTILDVSGNLRRNWENTPIRLEYSLDGWLTWESQAHCE